MATGGLYGNSGEGALIAQPGAETPGLYGKSPNGSTVATTGSETAGLYGNTVNFGGTFFEWFIFKEAATQPATPTGGSWDFATNIGTPPTGWTASPPASPTYSIWVSIALVNSRDSANFTWSTPGLLGTIATTNVGTTTTGSAGSSASVTNSGTPLNAVLNFTIPQGATGSTGATGATGPQGPQGNTGNAATLAIGSTTTGSPGTSATVTNSGTSSAAVFNFTIPRGDVGATGATGLTGATGTAATVAAGSTTTGAAGSSASVTNSGTSSAAVFDFTIPRGDTGATGAGVVAGGTTGQVLAKVSSTNYDTTWVNQAAGTVSSVGLTAPSFLSVSGSPVTTSGTLALSYSGTALPVANGGTGVTASSGANSVVLRDSNVNISVNLISEGFSNVAAAGTTTTLTVASVPNYVVTGSGGQTYQLPDATTLANGANYTFNNNQSSGTIVVKNNSSTTVATVQSGGYVDVILLSNSIAAGSWDVHNFAPSNVSWSTNTFDYPGSFTSGTWNGNAVAYNRGGTGQSAAFVAGGIVYGSTTSALAVTAIGTSGQVLTSAGAGTPTWTTPTTGTVTSVSGTTGRITSTGGNTPVIDLSSGVVSAGTTGSSTLIPIVTVDTYGRVTTITTASNPQGTVTSVATGTGLTGGPITASGTVALADTAVSPGAYTNANITVDQQGRITLASSGSAGGVTSFSAGSTGLTPNTATTGAVSLAGTLAVGYGGTGATSAAAARSNLSAAQSGANTDITSVTLTTGTISTAPSSSTDIVNKSYADSIATGINFHAACNYATTAALSAAYTYNNGTSGVGATITANAVGTLTIDSYTFVSGDVGKRILIKNEAGAYTNNTTPSAAFNGVYTLTTAGTAGVAYVLTRATDYDTSGTGTNEIDAGDLLLVLAGTTNVNTSWVQQTLLPITVGTTSLTFIQFAAIQTYTAGTGLSLTTNQFSITNTGTAGTYGSASQVPVLVTNAQGQVTSVTNTTIAIAGSAVTGNISGNAANVTGTVAIANGGTGQTSKTPAFDALSPTTTKGDLIAYDGTDNVRVGVGADTYVLTADSTQASGLTWAAAGGGGGGLSQAQALKLVSLRL